MNPTNLAAVDMRHTKLKAEEAALIAGELVKPSWASRNEGIHERVSFEDTLWGFEMAGGAYYNTPLRITYVKPESRAEQACIRKGDQVLRINGVDTSTLTLQEAHRLVLDSGINLRIAVTSPDDKDDAHYVYEDPIVDDPPLTAEQLKALELERVQKAIANAIRCRDLQWPWVRRKMIIYRESNCFLVPSKYEDKHRDQFPELPAQKIDYFYPMEKLTKVKPKANQNNVKENSLKEELADNDDTEEFEEEEEEVEEEQNSENEGNIEQEVRNERLEAESDKNHEDNSERKKFMLSQENESDNTNQEEENEIVENNLENQRKDSDLGSVSSFEVDNNNNHVVKSKEEQIDVVSENNNNNPVVDDNIINDIFDSELAIEDDNPKNDDEIIESVLNDNVDFKDTLNER